MASYYVRSGAGGAGTGADWANAYTTMTTALSGKAAGDVFYVSEDHAESTAGAVTLAFPGTLASPNFVYCVDHAGSVPPVSADLRTTGSVTTTGTNNLNFTGSVYCYGLIFSSGNGILLPGSASSPRQSFESCAMVLSRNIAANLMLIGAGSGSSRALVEWNNVTYQVANAGEPIACQDGCRFKWKNTANAIAGATIPSPLFAAIGNCDIELEGVDLSALGSGKTIFNGSNTPNFFMKDCKLGSSVTLASTPSEPVSTGYFVRTDSSGTNYRTEKYAYEGTQTVETTIVRTGGASDGTTTISWKIVTTANSRWVMPYVALPITIWNDTTGSSITVTVYGIWGGGAVPNNDDIWIEAEYLGSSATPIGSYATSTKADNLASGSAIPSDSSTWGGSTTAFKMSATFTPQMKGPITIRVKAAKASATFYVDPLIVLS